MGNDRWKKDTLDPTLERFPLRKQAFERSGGEPVADIYGPEKPPESIGFPGEYPFTRGVRATGYRGRLWTMRQYAGFGTAAESNERYRYLLSSTCYSYGSHFKRRASILNSFRKNLIRVFIMLFFNKS